MHPTEAVAITGMGCISAAGSQLAASIAHIDTYTERPNLGPKRPDWPKAHIESPVFSACFTPNFATDIVTDTRYSRTVHLAAHAIIEALQQARLSTEELSRYRVGVCLGTSVGASLNFLECCRALKNGTPPPLDEFVRFTASNPAMAIAKIFQLSGPRQTTTNACSSGTDAIGTAAQWVRLGLCDIAIAGGCDELSEVSYTGFSRLLITSAEPCKPFDKYRKGLNLGEGAGIVILESAQLRAKRQIAPQGYVLGYGTCTDAYHLTAPHEQATGLKRALDAALQQAQSTVQQIAFVNAHATATPTNDAVEGNFYCKHLPHTPIVATKGATGHTLGAAGAIEAVLTTAHLARQSIPASPGFSQVDPAIGLRPTTAQSPIRGTIALSTSLAFGGNNSVLLLAAPSFQPTCKKL